MQATFDFFSGWFSDSAGSFNGAFVDDFHQITRSTGTAKTTYSHVKAHTAFVGI